MSGQFRTCPICGRLTLNQRCDHPNCPGDDKPPVPPTHTTTTEDQP